MALDRIDALTKLALNLVDDQPVDWATVSQDLGSEHSSLLESIKSLARLSQAFRDNETAEAIGHSGAADTTGHPDIMAQTDPVVEAARHSSLFTWGSFFVLEVLGQGSYGTVYRAFDSALQREVALKLLRPNSRTRQTELLGEARRLAVVRHPNVVAVHGVELHDEKVGVWFDLLRGPTLDGIVRTEGPLSWSEALVATRDTLRAVRAVHDSGLVHGDVKAGNVIQESDGRTILFDFGSGRSASSSEALRSGSPIALPPEALEGESVGVGADLYAAGILLFYLLSGRYPIDAADLDELRDAHAAGRRTPLSRLRTDTPEFIEDLLDRATAFNPSGRFASAAEMEAALDKALERLGRTKEVLRTAPAGNQRQVPNNVPRFGSSFVGRRRDLEEIANHLTPGQLVSIVGTGGCGKTRLASELCSSLQNLQDQESASFCDGIWWVDLAAFDSDRDLIPAVARALSVPDHGHEPLEGLVLETLRQRDTLLVLDNCEHLLPACRELLTRLFERSAHSAVLLTSRQSPGLENECCCRIDELPLPPSETTEPEVLVRFESVELFARRAQEVEPSFRVDRANAVFVNDIVRRLDGIPLALELAAGRTRVLSLEQISSRLADRFRLLRGGRTEDPRHRTLSSLLDWSYDELDPAEKVLLRRLSLFRGSWNVAAMEAICQGPFTETDRGDEQMVEEDLLDLLVGLVDKFLVTKVLLSSADRSKEVTRFRLLETIREYARDQLEEAEDAGALAEVHAGHFAFLAGDYAIRLLSAEQELILTKLEVDYGNFSRAIDTWLDRGHLAQGTKMVNDLCHYRWMKGYWPVAVADLKRVTSHRTGMAIESGLDLPPDPVLIRAKLWLGHYDSSMNRIEDAGPLLEEALEEARQLGDGELISSALVSLGQRSFGMSDYEGSQKLLVEALGISHQLGDERRSAIILGSLGNSDEMMGRTESARDRFVESLRLARKIQDRHNVQYALQRLASIYANLDELDLGESSAREALRLAMEASNRWGIAATRAALGMIAANRKEYPAAARECKEALATYRELSDVQSLIRTLQLLGFVYSLDGNAEDSRAFLNESLDLAEAPGFEWDLNLVALTFAHLAILVGRFDLAAQVIYFTEEGMKLDGYAMREQEAAAIVEMRKELADQLDSAAWEEIATGFRFDRNRLIAMCRQV